MEMKTDLVELGFEMKLPIKDWVSTVVCKAARDTHHKLQKIYINGKRGIR